MSRRFPMHLILECQDCDWGTEDYHTGQAAASRHASQTGHRVSGEVGYHVEYGPATPPNERTTP